METQMTKSIIGMVQNGAVRADGRFTLTDAEISFEPFNKEFGLGPYHLAKATIASAEKCFGKGAGILPITSDAIRLKMTDGHHYEFVLASSDQWVAEINQWLEAS